MLNVTPVQNPWEQLTLAYENGIDRLWILNVGDLKPMEYPISQFMDMAWNPHKYDDKQHHPSYPRLVRTAVGEFAS